ncbi:hypothetical protein JCM10003_1335 [Bacteroides pyogenes JCM 10003]|nr:hypothetical protein JCM10003_1335 [Bacteroides pyogenes JCM 10003]
MRTVHRYLLVRRQAFLFKRRQCVVRCHHLRLQRLIVCGESYVGITVVVEVDREVGIQRGELLQQVVQGGLVHRHLCARVEQLQFNLVHFQYVGIARLQTPGVHFRKLFGIPQPFVQQLLLPAQQDDVETRFFGLQQQLLAEKECAVVVNSGFQSVQLPACGIQAREVETLRHHQFADGFAFVFRFPQMGVRERRVREVILCPVFQLLRRRPLRFGAQLFVVRFDRTKHPVDISASIVPSSIRKGKHAGECE